MEVGNIRGPSITIANGQTLSNTIRCDQAFSWAKVFTLFAPATLDATTFKIEVTDDIDAQSVVWREWNDGTNDITAPGAGDARTYEYPNFSAMRIKAGASVAAARTWAMSIGESY